MKGGHGMEARVNFCFEHLNGMLSRRSISNSLKDPLPTCATSSRPVKKANQARSEAKQQPTSR